MLDLGGLTPTSVPLGSYNSECKPQKLSRELCHGRFKAPLNTVITQEVAVDMIILSIPLTSRSYRSRAHLDRTSWGRDEIFMCFVVRSGGNFLSSAHGVLQLQNSQHLAQTGRVSLYVIVSCILPLPGRLAYPAYLMV